MRADVARWLHRRTFRASDYDPWSLPERKHRQGRTVGVVQYVPTGTDVEAVTWGVGGWERPPMRTVPGYRSAGIGKAGR
jgi:hypothetical protein